MGGGGGGGSRIYTICQVIYSGYYIQVPSRLLGMSRLPGRLHFLATEFFWGGSVNKIQNYHKYFFCLLKINLFPNEIDLFYHGI